MALADFPDYGEGMSGSMSYVVPVAILAVAVVLGFGLVNMLRGGSPNRSQTLMRWRVILQFVAVVLIMTALWLKGG
jgi:Hypoxia induced protein conserved region